MSEPKRFNFSATIVHHIDGETSAAIKYHTEPNGLFVSYEDYARLKAEVERLADELNYRKAIAIRVGIEAAKEGKQP